MLWHLAQGPIAGLQLLGAAAARALLGLRLALPALAVGIGFQHWADAVAWTAVAPAWLLGALLAALLAAAVLAPARRDDRRLGPVPRVAAAFAAGAASMFVVMGVRAWLGVLPSISPHDVTVFFATATATAMAMAMAMAMLRSQPVGLGAGAGRRAAA